MWTDKGKLRTQNYDCGNTQPKKTYGILHYMHSYISSCA